MVDSEFERVKDQYVELQEVFRNFAAKEMASSVYLLYCFNGTG